MLAARLDRPWNWVRPVRWADSMNQERSGMLARSFTQEPQLQVLPISDSISFPSTAASGGAPTRLTINGSSISGRNGDVLIKPTSAVAVNGFLNNLRLSGGIT